MASNACIQLVVKADERMELNVTNPCLEGVLEAVHDFSQFKTVTVNKEDTYCIGIRNCTGLDGSYGIESDAGIRELVEEHHRVMEAERLDEALFCDLVHVCLCRGEGESDREKTEEESGENETEQKSDSEKTEQKSDSDETEQKSGEKKEEKETEQKSGEKKEEKETEQKSGEGKREEKREEKETSQKKDNHINTPSQQGSVMWLELHTISPFIRLYPSIPFKRDTKRCSLFGNTFDAVEEKRGMLFSVLRFENESASMNGKRILVCVDRKEERPVWKHWIEELNERRVQSIPLLSPTKDPEYPLPSSNQITITPLPAHPSITLQYYNQPYRRIKERVIVVRLTDCSPFTIPIDSARTRAVRVRHKEEQAMVLVETSVERGRKVVTLSAPLQVINHTSSALHCGFMLNDGEESEELLPPQEALWAGLRVMREGSVFVAGVERKVIPLQYVREKLGSGLLNIGTAAQPFYVMVHEEVASVPVMHQPSQQVLCYKLFFSDVLSITNLLPEAVEYRIINAEGRVFACCALKSGEKRTVSSLKFRREEGLRISVRVVRSDFEFSDYEHSIFVTVRWRSHS